MHFYETQCPSVFLCGPDPAVQAHLVDAVAEQKGKDQVRQLVDRRANKIHDVEQEKAAGASGEVLPGRLAGQPHEKTEGHEHEQDLDIELDKIIEHMIFLTENMAYHIINMLK